MRPTETTVKPPALVANVGRMRTPTTLRSVRPGPGNWVCFWNHTSATCTAMTAVMIPGSRKTWTMYRRGMMMSPGYSPPKMANCSHVPITGIDMTIAETPVRMPVPESRSSGSE